VARPAFGGRRALSRIGQLLAFAGVVMLVAGFLAFLGGVSGPVLDAGARRLIDGAGATGSTARIQTRLPGPDDSQDAGEQDAAVQQAIDTALRGLPATVYRSVLAVSAPAVVDGEPVRVQGRLAKSPSWWIKSVDVTRIYDRIDGVVMPVALESKAQVRILGEATLKVTFNYSEIDGRPVTHR